MNYFVVCIDYGREREAIVNPETTRNGIIANIRSGEYRGPILFIHEVNDFGDGHMIVSDVKDELISAAGLPEENIHPIDLQSIRFDHKRDLAKHGEPV